MLKIFVTGDAHVGLKYASHEKAAYLAGARREAFKGMVEAADREGCGLFVVTGDLFENLRVSAKDVRAVLEILATFRGTVAVLPGNHDHCDRSDDFWQRFSRMTAEAGYDNILPMTDERPYGLTVDGENVVLYPAICASLHSAPGRNALDWIKNTAIPDDGAFRIGVAHGAVEGETIDSEGSYYPMTPIELENIPVDVWLLGHTHVPFPDDLTEEFTVRFERIFNPGTPVQTDVACNTEGLCFILEIGDDKAVRAKKFVSGKLRFFRKTLTLSAGGMEADLDRALREMGDDSVVDLILKGAVTPEEYEDRARTLETALSRFVEGTYDDHGLSRQITGELIASEFSEISFSAGLLKALLDEPKEAQLAYELLTSLKEGK